MLVDPEVAGPPRTHCPVWAKMLSKRVILRVMCRAIPEDVWLFHLRPSEWIARCVGETMSCFAFTACVESYGPLKERTVQNQSSNTASPWPLFRMQSTLLFLLMLLPVYLIPRLPVG